MPNAKWRARAWPLAISGILLSGMASNAIFVILASSDPAAAVEPDYYRKALAWDDEMAQQERNIALGWSTHTALTLGTGGHPGRLELTVVDGSGRPLSGAAVSAFVMHNARATQVQHLALHEVAAGRYSASVLADRPGLWEIRLSVERNAQHYTARERVQAVPAS